MKNYAVKCSPGTLLVPFGTIIVYHIFRKLQDGKLHKIFYLLLDNLHNCPGAVNPAQGLTTNLPSMGMTVSISQIPYQ